MDENIVNKYQKALRYEIFEKEEYWFAKNEIQKAECIFDIGWHIWYFSEWCRLLSEKAEIHYFEPVKDFYEKAIKNLWNDNKIILNNYGIWAKTGNWTFLINDEKTMQSSKYTSFLNPKWIESKVKFYEMRKYLKDKNIKKIDVLKMDIEWMEFEVLSSWTDFERNKIQNFIAEIHILNDGMRNMWQLLLPQIKNIFSSTETFNSPYSKDIFLIWCKK